MNKEELKQYIDDNIYENQDGEITGESLNAVLKAIVDDGGTEVEANPTGTPTATMEKIKIGETIYTAPQGPPGEPGEDGQDGQPGAPGPANTLIIGTVTDGEQAAASIIGDAPNQVLNLILPKGEKGDPGQNAVNPFKGWWPDLATLKAAITAIPGDYAYVFDPSPATTASIYVYDSSDTDNHWVDSGNDVDASNVSSFMSGQPLNTVNIVDELHDQDPNNVPSARQASILGARTVASDAVIEKVDVDIATMVQNGYITSVWNGSTPPGGIVSSSMQKVTTIGLDTNTSYVIFNGKASPAQGYGFYDANGDCIYVAALDSTLKEYIVKRPHNAVTFKTLSDRPASSFYQDDFYCYQVKGDVLDNKPDYSEDGFEEESANAFAVSKLIAKLGGIDDVIIERLPYHFNVKGTWDVSQNSGAGGINTTGTGHVSDYIDIEGYDAVIFLAPVAKSQSARGFAFLDENQDKVDQYAWKYDSSLADTSYAPYYYEVKDNYKYLITKVNTPKPFFCVGIKGKNVYNIIAEAVEPLSNLLTKTKTVLVETGSYGKQRAMAESGKVQVVADTPARSMTCKTFDVESGKTYIVKGAYPESITTRLLYWADAEDNVLGTDLKGTNGEYNDWTEGETVTAPEGATKVYMNCYTNYIISPGYEIGFEELTYINVNLLKQQVDANTQAISLIEENSSTETKLMKVTFDENMNVMVRSHLNPDKDIAITMFCSVNGDTGNEEPENITLNAVYIGDKILEDGQLVSSANLIKSMTDAIPPLISNFGYIYVQHGYRIGKFTTAHSLTDSDLNTEWEDQNGKRYYIGKIDSASVYIIPKVTMVDGVAVPSINFWEKNVQKPTTLQEVGGNRTLNGICDRYDLPIQEILSTSYFVDGVEKTRGTFYCNKFTVCQKLACKKPYGLANVSDWFENPIPYDGDALIMIRSFNFVGSSCTINTILDFKVDMGISEYMAVQPMLSTGISGYDSVTYLPKVKKGTPSYDYGFATPTSDNMSVYRREDQLYDADALPDRVVTIVSSSTPSQPDLFGFASGISLDEGLITSISALDQVPLQDSSVEGVNDCITIKTGSSYGGSKGGKLYFHYFKAVGNHENDGWNNKVVNPNFVHKVTTYFTWFDPNQNQNQQVFWIRENEACLVYCHSQNLTGKAEVNLPAFMEGMKIVEVLEHTEGATNLTDTVVGGRIYVKYEANDSGQANFITLKLK